MTRKTLLSTVLLAGMLSMAAAHAQDGSTETTAGADAALAAAGQVEISEALADALVDAGAYADTDTAMQALFDARAEGMGWGEIAQQHGMDLGLIVADAMSEGRSTAGLAIAEENRAGGDEDAGTDIVIDAGDAQAGAGAATAASASTRAQVGQGIAADARVDARIDAGLRGSTSGRPVGVGAPTLPVQVTRPILPDRPQRPERPQRGGKPGGG